jgi:hypothetical protein
LIKQYLLLHGVLFAMLNAFVSSRVYKFMQSGIFTVAYVQFEQFYTCSRWTCEGQEVTRHEVLVVGKMPYKIW